jgi:hypothetical protein
MAKFSTGTEVRAWGLSTGRTDVTQGRGRLSSTLVEAFNAEHPRAKYVPASKAPAPTVEVKFKPQADGKGRTVAKKVNVAAARAWAVEQGTEVGPRGTLAKAVLVAYAKTL